MSSSEVCAAPSWKEVAQAAAKQPGRDGAPEFGSRRYSFSSGRRLSADPEQLSRAEHLVKSTLAGAGNPRQSWTFSSSGWLFTYHFGVIKCLRDLKLNQNIYVIGSSGGACAGSFLFLQEADIDACVEYVLECAERARTSWRNALRISEYVKGAIDKFQPPGAAKRLEGNMEVSVTRLQLPWRHWPPVPFRNLRIKHFSSDKQMEEAVIASARAVPFPPIHIRGIGDCIDGVFTDSQLISSILLGRSFFTLHAEDAISVCPFYSSRADIRPSRYVNPLWAAYPPQPDKLADLYELGYRDALAWLLQHGKVPLGFAGADTADTADSATSSSRASLGGDRAAWRQSLQRTIGSIQGAMAEAGQMVRDGAASAAGCDSAAEGLVIEAVSAGHSALSLLCWSLVICELFWHSCISAMVAAWAPVLPLNTVDSWRRFTNVSRSMASPRLFMKCVPKLSPRIDLTRNKSFARNLREHSILYRLLQHVLL